MHILTSTGNDDPASTGLNGIMVNPMNFTGRLYHLQSQPASLADIHRQR